MSFIIGTAAIVVFASYIFHLWNVFSYWRRKGVVGPTPWPIFGNYGPVFFRIKTERELIQTVYDAYPQEKCVGIYYGSRPALLLRDPRMVRQVLVLNPDNFPNRIVSSATSKFTKGLSITPANTYWKMLRKTLLPLFSRKQLSKIMPNMKIGLNEYLKYVDEIISKNARHNISKLNSKCMLAICSKALIGTNMGGFKEDSKFELTADMVLDLVSLEIVRVTENIFPFLWSIIELVTLNITKIMYNYYVILIKSAVRNREDVKCEGTDVILDFLIEMKASNIDFDDEVIFANMTTLVLATMQATSMLLSYVSFELAENQSIQNKCHEEVRLVLKRYNGDINMESLSEMKYLDMVIEEVLRLYSLDYLLDRICGKAYNFPETDLVVDKGVLMYIPMDAFHRDAQYYPDPDKVIPERFSQENKANITPCTFLPFADGPRKCIGRPLAKMAIVMVLAEFLRRFKLLPSEVNEELKFRRDLRVRRHRGIYLNIVRRE